MDILKQPKKNSEKQNKQREKVTLEIDRWLADSKFPMQTDLQPESMREQLLLAYQQGKATIPMLKEKGVVLSLKLQKLLLHGAQRKKLHREFKRWSKDLPESIDLQQAEKQLLLAYQQGAATIPMLEERGVVLPLELQMLLFYRAQRKKLHREFKRWSEDLPESIDLQQAKEQLLLAYQQGEATIPMLEERGVVLPLELQMLLFHRAQRKKLHKEFKRWSKDLPESIDLQQAKEQLYSAYLRGSNTIPGLKVELSTKLKEILTERQKNILFERDLKRWVENRTAKAIDLQNIEEAANRIKAAYYSKVERLDLSGLNLKTVPAALGRLQGLRSLVLCKNQLKKLPRTLKNIATLTTIDCSQNRISNPSLLSELRSKGCKANVKGNPLFSVAALNSFISESNVDDKDFQFLVELDRWAREAPLKEERKTAVERIATAYQNKARVIDLSYLGLGQLPDALTRLGFTSEINIIGNPIADSLNFSSRLANKVADKKLSFVIEEEKKEQQVQIGVAHAEGDGAMASKEPLPIEEKLNSWAFDESDEDQQAHKFSVIKDILEAYRNHATTLDLSNHQLVDLPEGVLSELKYLTHLDLTNNRLRTLPADISKLKLTSLSLMANELAQVPPQVREIHSLRELNLSYNQFTTFSLDTLESLRELKKLYLNDNQLQELLCTQNFSGEDSNATLLSKLERLVLFNNKLKEVKQLPTGIKYLDVSRNALEIFPICVFQCQQLEELGIFENPIVVVPQGLENIFMGSKKLTLIGSDEAVIDGNDFDIFLRKVHEAALGVDAPQKVDWFKQLLQQHKLFAIETVLTPVKGNDWVSPSKIAASMTASVPSNGSGPVPFATEVEATRSIATVLRTRS